MSRNTISGIIKNINMYVASTAHSDHSDWYVGIATNIITRLFTQHNVSRDSDAWIYCEAYTEEDARRAEQILQEEFGYDGHSGGGDHPLYIYAYLKNDHTLE